MITPMIHDLHSSKTEIIFGYQSLATNSSQRRMLSVLERMRRYPEFEWTLDRMADAAALSVPHFSDLCRRHVGVPPLAFLIRQRLRRAEELLKSGKYNVSTVSKAVGYQDPFYFSRLFRKHMGISPKAYRLQSDAANRVVT